MKLLIVGGVAGGASAATRARRLDEFAEIIMFERGIEPSFANCGLPYYIGGTIESRSELLIAPKQRLIDRYNLDVRTRNEVLSIDRAEKIVRVHDIENDREYEESYDKLILAPGAAPLRPPIDGIDHPRVYTLRDMDDTDKLYDVSQKAKQAVIVGAGFIGIEMAENLIARGVETAVVELVDQVLPPWDAEMVTTVAAHLRENGISLHLGDSATAFEPEGEAVRVRLKSGHELLADMVMLCVGVRPESKLAKDAGLEVGPQGGILVNERMQTNDPDIYAAGDAVQVASAVTGEPIQIPLAGPANRQGRIAADQIFGRDSRYRGTQGTAVVGVFEKTVAMTGLSEKALVASGWSYEKIYLHPSNHAGYYPGMTPFSMKLLFAPADGRILGAQAVGGEGVDKRIDVIAAAIQAGMTVYDLEEMELSYAPQYGSAKDPVNMAGFIAAGVLRGDQPIVHFDVALSEVPGPLMLDVRTPNEVEDGVVPGSINIPVDELRGRLGELPQDRLIYVYCQFGMRGYLATRILLQHGFNAKNLSGGYKTYLQVVGSG